VTTAKQKLKLVVVMVEVVVVVAAVVVAVRCRRRAYVLPMLLFKFRPLSFDNGWTDLNADYCVNTVDEKILYSYKFGEW